METGGAGSHRGSRDVRGLGREVESNQSQFEVSQAEEPI